MDRKLPETSEIEQLIQQSAAARTCLEREAALLRRRLDIPDRLRSSMAAHPKGWIMGSLGSGLIASALLRRRPRAATAIVARNRASSGIPGLILTLVKPMVKIWLANFLKDWMSRQMQNPANTTDHRRSPTL
jgi:hypothetical protein